MKNVVGVLVVAFVFCMCLTAHANVFGVASSQSSADIIRTCNERYRVVYSTNLVLTGLELGDAKTAMQLIESFADIRQLQEIANISVLAERDVLTRQELETAAETLLRKAFFQFYASGCGDVFEQTLTENLDGNVKHPTVGEYIGPEWRFHLGASVTGSPGAGGDVESSGGFTPALGASFATNGHAFTLLIDPDVVEPGAVSFSRSSSASRFGRSLLEANLGGRSVYASYSRYFSRGDLATRGITFRLVARQLDFSVIEEDAEGDESTLFQLDGVMVAPTIAFTLASHSIRFGEDDFVMGLQAGVTARSFFGDFGGLDLETERSLLTGSSEADDVKNVMWAAGLDLTLFMQYQNISPFARLTLLGSKTTAPRSMRSLQVVFGLDVLATLRFASEPDDET